MKKLICLFLIFNIQFYAFGQKKELADYVNPFIGASTNIADAGAYHGLGKTFPGAATPFGMVQISPNTITGGDNGCGYSYEHTSIEGFAFTQMSGVGWYGDLGNFLVMPTTGPLKTIAGTLQQPEQGYRSTYLKSTEKASAGYYSVFLSKYGVKAEMAAAPHSGMLRFNFPRNEQSRIQIDLARRVGGTSTFQHVEVVDDHTIKGWMKCTPEGGGWGNGAGKADYTVYFYAQFSKPLKNYGVSSADVPDGMDRRRESVTSKAYQAMVAKAIVERNIRVKEGKHLGFYTEFATQDQEQVLMKTGISFTNMVGAEDNLQHEITGWNFDAVRQQAKTLWNNALGKIKIEGGTETQKKVFYTAMYHTMIDPRNMEDINGNYTGGDGKIHKGSNFIKRSIFSGWDVFRSQMPLQTFINPVVVRDMISSLVSLADEKKENYLERWEFLNAYSGCMLGNPAVNMITDAYAKGIRDFDVARAYELSIRSVERFGNGTAGYVPGNLSISTTLEYAYNEWCVSQLAKWLGKSDDYQKYQVRSKSYQNVFDKEKGWFRPKDKSGNWLPWPAEGRLKQGYGTIESNPYQQGFFVPQDVSGMVDLMGGREKVIADLNDMFEHTPENMLWNNYYNHANEPVHHVPFLFNRLGAPWLTQKWSRMVCNNAYKDGVNGLVGNEDVGQMSAWYVLAAIGIHPVCPGDTRQEITSPVFDKVSIKLDPNYASGKYFFITAKNNSAKNIFIQSAKLNGKIYNKCYIDYKDIVAGGELELVMGDQPNKKWGLTE